MTTESRMLSPVDMTWLGLDSPDNPMVITVFMRVEGLSPEALRHFLGDYWLRWARFRARPVPRGGTWWWEAAEGFDLDGHLELDSGPLADDRALEAWVSARASESLPSDRPRWKFSYCPLGDNQQALLLRIHHCYADGLSLLGVFENLCTAQPEQAPEPLNGEIHELRQQWIRAGWQWLAGQTHGPAGDGTAGTPSLPGALNQGLEQALRLVYEGAAFLLEESDTLTPLRGQLTGEKRCCWSSGLPLQRIRRLAGIFDCKINDILLACVARALARRLDALGVERGAIRLHAAVPVDLRRVLPDSLQPAPGVLGNLFGTVFVPLPVDAGSAPEAVYRIKHETLRLKGSWQPVLSWLLLGLGGVLPEPWQGPLAELFTRKASAVVSNVPGTGERRYLAGCPVHEQLFWVPQAGDMGLGVSIISYAGEVRFGVQADTAVLPEPSHFRDDCLEALGQLERVAEAMS